VLDASLSEGVTLAVDDNGVLDALMLAGVVLSTDDSLVSVDDD